MPEARWPMYVALLGLLAAASLFLATSCAGGPTEVALSELVADQKDHHGDTVATDGTVREFRDDPDAEPYYVLEDADHNRVRLLPDEMAAEHAGRRVEVRGMFEFDPDQGRLLRVDRITVAP